MIVTATCAQCRVGASESCVAGALRLEDGDWVPPTVRIT